MQEDLNAVLKKLAEGLAARAVKNPWHPATNWRIVQHRIERSKELGRPCNCEELCQPYMAMMEKLRAEGQIA